MKLKLIAYSALLIGSMAPALAQEVTLSREECIKIALDASPTVRVADMEVSRARYAKRETTGQLMPTVDFQLAYQRSIELQTMRMDFGGQSQSIKMGSDNNWNMGFNAQLPLIAPTLWKAISLSETQILAAAESARASRLDLVDQVNKAYYSLMLAIASQKVIQQNYDNAKFNAEVYEKQFAAGTASEFDVLRSSVQVKNVEPDLLQANISIRQCRLQLVVLMGVDYTLEITPDVTLADLQKEMYAAPLGASTDDFSANSQLRSIDIQKDIAKKSLSLKQLAYVPTLGASYNLNWSALSNGSPFRNQEFNPYSNVGLALSVPIFSGLGRWNAVKQAKVQLAEVGLQRENLLNSLQMQRDLALDNINMQAAQIESSKEGMMQAAKAHQIMQKSFEIGAATYLDLRDAELADTSAQLSYYQSIYNYLVSTSELDLLLGKESGL